MGGPCVWQDGPRDLGCVGSAVWGLGISVGPALEEAWSREVDLTDLTPQPARLFSNSFSKFAVSFLLAVGSSTELVLISGSFPFLGAGPKTFAENSRPRL